ncbi:DUF3103 family protein [Sulfidibacter corallicola]|uniref:DUF3103 family protein n=1 Tax=Sulfidibacter corallicola TaxID=2818388 RepID=A0A8A4TTD3_SULCO|nr:DUF3103 family protein [Sulfidibacter corallicola]QTD52321.1 DUF3103 family protein [Sulfidibacter corallicola]
MLDLSELHVHKRDLAQRVAVQLKDTQFRKFMESRIDAKRDQAPLVTLINDYAQIFQAKGAADLASELASLDLQIRQAKGIESYTQELLSLRLVAPATSHLQASSEYLVAYQPAGDDAEWTAIEAFDTAGNLHLLDVVNAPAQPVLVVGIDSREDLRAGLAYMNDAFRAAGLQAEVPATVQSKAGVDTHKLDKVHLNDDQEPWISGNAEVYALVNGVHPDDLRANIQAVDMPYLDKDGKNYYPNQILIFWDQYRYAAANIVLMEHDDNTNYQDLVVQLINAVAEVMRVFPESAPYSGLVNLAGEIIRAMPSHWFSNDDDYLDVYYTIEKGQRYTDYYGASGNARMTLSPYILQSN